jgi:5-bromo-4-chloroindolyl phosphate hydrolysis protein
MRLQGEAAEKPVNINLFGPYRTFVTMGILNINDLKEGMTLAADVKNKHGNIMIRQGMTLSEKHIMLLKAWGISDADVDGFDRDQLNEEEMKTVSPEVIEVIEKDLRAFFPSLEGNEIMSEIYRITKKLKIKQVMES